MNEANHRPIRSFVKREGRMTNAQTRALEELMPRYGITELDSQINLDELFQRQAPRFIEIGFGMGRSLLQIAAANPDNDYLGIEVHRPGVGSTLLKIDELGLNNLKVINHDAVEVLKAMIPDNSLDGAYLFFPDPWHKKKHHKRRIVKPEFVQQIHAALKPEGIFHIATDWEDYALHIMELMSSVDNFENVAGTGNYSDRGDRPLTKYEQRGQRLGHGVWDMVFKRG